VSAKKVLQKVNLEAASFLEVPCYKETEADQPEQEELSLLEVQPVVVAHCQPESVEGLAYPQQKIPADRYSSSY
jgi:hypothetical protein